MGGISDKGKRVVVKSGKLQAHSGSEAKEAGPARALTRFNVNHHHHESIRIQ